MKDKESKIKGEENSEKIKVGTNIIKNLSTTFYPNPKIIFDELITNSRDAMANIVKMHVNNNTITIEDDGDGMSRDELIHFFFISHSNKLEQPIKSKGGVKREIIGKFGIGKLSLYQICKWFEITTWKNGVESKATFNFEDFEKEKYVDDFSLHIISETRTSKKNGTRIVLHDLKKKNSANDIKRHLIRTMPFTKDFKIIISGGDLARPVELRSEDILHGNVASKYEIDEDVAGVGKVTGTIIYKKHEPGDFGVYIRVFGRVVNLSDPHGIINFSSLTSAFFAARKIYANLNVDSLNNAIQTNRAGFVKDNPSYIAFTKWLTTKLNKLNKEMSTKIKEMKRGAEVIEVKDIVSSFFSSRGDKKMEGIKPKQKHLKRMKRGAKLEEDTILNKKSYILLHGRRFGVEVEPIGRDKPEAIMDKKENKIVINSDNPLYEISRANGGVWGVQYHALRASIIVFAIEISKNLDEFIKNYNLMVKESEEIVQNMKRRLVINN